MVIELKKPGVRGRAAFDENLTHYEQQIPALFCFSALLVTSNLTSGGRDPTESCALAEAKPSSRKQVDPW